MKKIIPALALCLAAALSLLMCPALAADTPLPLSLAEPLSPGDEVIRLLFPGDFPEGLQVNAFIGDEEAGASAALLDGGIVELTLQRPLREGETVRVAAGCLTDGTLSRRTVLGFTVESLFGAFLPRLRARADAMWPVWQDWAEAYQAGTVYMRLRFRDLPFVTYPDEAPAIAVKECGGAALVFVSEALPEGWEISFASGIPAVFSPAEWDKAANAYTGAAGFDSVYLVSPQTDSRASVTIVYERQNQFRPSYPIVEWVEPEAEDPLAFNCYGFGTTRAFTGGMFAVVGRGAAWYAEYDAGGVLTSCTDLISECVYDNTAAPVSGPRSEEGVSPLKIW